MKKTPTILFIFFILSMSLATAHGEESFAEAEELIKANIPCEELSEEQLESIGDYHMEQMHPGEDHEIMDERMGGEGSETLRQMHINMAQSFYCGEHGAMSQGMMNMMMQDSNFQDRNNMMDGGMMKYRTGYLGTTLILLLYLAVAIFIIQGAYELIIKKKRR